MVDRGNTGAAILGGIRRSVNVQRGQRKTPEKVSKATK
jgi:hypothetical protein